MEFFFKTLIQLAEKNNVKLVLNVSADPAVMPEYLKAFVDLTA